MSVLNILKRESEPVSFATGDLIIENGTSGDFMYYVLSGEVVIEFGGKEINTVQAGSTVGEMAIISDQPRSANVIAKTDCELIRVDQERFEYLVQQVPHFSIQVMGELVERIRRMTELGIDFV